MRRPASSPTIIIICRVRKKHHQQYQHHQLNLNHHNPNRPPLPTSSPTIIVIIIINVIIIVIIIVNSNIIIFILVSTTPIARPSPPDHQPRSESADLINFPFVRIFTSKWWIHNSMFWHFLHYYGLKWFVAKSHWSACTSAIPASASAICSSFIASMTPYLEGF